MKDIYFKRSFNSQLKDVKKYPEFNQKQLDEYILMLQRGEKLPEKTRDHKLAAHSRSEYQGCRDFHLTPDIVVIYRLNKNDVEIVAIGKHNKLKLTSSWNYKCSS